MPVLAVISHAKKVIGRNIVKRGERGNILISGSNVIIVSIRPTVARRMPGYVLQLLIALHRASRGVFLVGLALFS